METIEELREQVRPTDLVTFDLLTVSLREDISSAVNEYHVMTTDSEMEVGEADEGGGGAGDERQSLLMARKKNEDHYQSLENLRMVTLYLLCYLQWDLQERKRDIKRWSFSSNLLLWEMDIKKNSPSI